MRADEAQELNRVPELLFHTTLTVVDNQPNPSGPARATYPLSTHTTMEAAKEFAPKALAELGYHRSDFETYEIRPESTSNAETDEEVYWPLGDRVIVVARRTGPYDFLIGISTTSNKEMIPSQEGDPSQLQLRHSDDQLHYVVWTKVDYNINAWGHAFAWDIKGVCLSRADAIEVAETCLLSGEVDREDFVKYEERSSHDPEEVWHFGDDDVVYALAPTGETFTVAVRTALKSRSQLDGI
jgi:hypothetical protein